LKNTEDFHSPARLELINVSISYNSHPALEDVSVEIPHGARVAVVGPNGAGKSTLFKALVGLLPVQRGQILIHGRSLGTHQDCVAYIPQREDVDWRFPVTVEDVVMMGRFGKYGWFRRAGAPDHQIVRQSMDQMGILPLADRAIGELSGGQQQRAFLARALAQEPHILLMDEPFTGIDIGTQEVTMNVLDQLRQQQVTVLVSTHDLNMAAQRFDLVLLLNHHLVAFGTPQQVFTQQNVTAAFKSQVMFMDSAVIVDQCCGVEEDEHQREP